MTADEREEIKDFAGGAEFAASQHRPDVIADDVPGGFYGFVGVEGIFAGYDFAPAGDAVYVNFYEEDAAVMRGAEAGLERRD